ncbi:serine hydrolase [Streptomyces pactum]|uniref:serine hydrolase n=1 Tax=Streptomyces pactum TaxID=68249 RepID=UPI0036FCD846
MTPTPPPGPHHRIRTAFTTAGVTGQLYATDIDNGTDIGIHPDTPAPTASLHKLCLVATLYRHAAQGRLDLTTPIDIPATPRTPGSTGLSVMHDPARLSLRDLAALTIAVSDSAAADTLWDHLGQDTVNATMAELGLTHTIAVHPMRDLYARMAHDAGDHGPTALTDPTTVARLSVLHPQHTNRSTPRDIATLLAAIWRDEVCDGPTATALRHTLGLQTWHHRLASGFPFDDVRVSGKTGTLPTLRHEAGVVEYPDGGRYAVAVFTRAASTAATLPAADAVIGTTARIAIDALRTPGHD